MEIYNEEIRDLLSKDPKSKCELREHAEKGVYVKESRHFQFPKIERETRANHPPQYSYTLTVVMYTTYTRATVSASGPHNVCFSKSAFVLLLSHPRIVILFLLLQVMQAGKKRRSVGETLMNQSVLCYECAACSHSSFTISSLIHWFLLFFSLLVPIPFLRSLWSSAVWRTVLVIILEVMASKINVLLLSPVHYFIAAAAIIMIWVLTYLIIAVTSSVYSQWWYTSADCLVRHSWEAESRWFSWFWEAIENRIHRRKI